MYRALGSFLFAGLLLAGAGCGGGSPTTPDVGPPKNLKGPGMTGPSSGVGAPAPPPPPAPK